MAIRDNKLIIYQWHKLNCTTYKSNDSKNITILSILRIICKTLKILDLFENMVCFDLLHYPL